MDVQFNATGLNQHFNVFWLSKDNISNEIIHNKKIVKSMAEAVTFLAPAVNTNYQENHTTKCHIFKKRTSEQNQQILALAATYQWIKRDSR